ncbi:hypothetical protein KY314_02520 [Candidatus Woesearchaeota archaeon]|nr:hypothetical protein [Candidatus Woesearchaeota archaeon]
MDTRVRKIILASFAIIIVLMLTGCALKDFKIKRKAQITDTEMDEIDKALQEIEKVSELIEQDNPDVPIEEMKDQTPEEIDSTGLPTKTVKEGELIEFPNLKATDPDGDIIEYTFTSPLNRKGKWQTKEGDAGKYKITITASDGENTVSQDVVLIVQTLNKPPVISIEEETIIVSEGEKIEIRAKATDPDGDKVKLSYTGWMTGPVKTTDYQDAGEHTVILTATDGKEEVRQELEIIVENINRGPKLEQIGDIVIKEGDKITIEPTASDPDGDEINYIYSRPVDPLGVWETEEGDAGKYRIMVTATDGDLEDTTSFYVVVESLNKPPVITVAQEIIRIEEGETVYIDAMITDPENDELTITYTGWMTTDTYTTDYEDQGTHEVKINAADGINTATKIVTVIVEDINRAPVFETGSFD